MTSWPLATAGHREEYTAVGAVTGNRKYYAALGQTIAVPNVSAGGGAGTLSYLLADHLDSTVEALDAAGTRCPAVRSSTGRPAARARAVSRRRTSCTRASSRSRGMRHSGEEFWSRASAAAQRAHHDFIV